MDRQQPLDRLQFYNYKVVDQDVDTKACLQTDVAIDDGKRQLAVNPVTARLKLVGKALLINRFEQSRPERAVNRNSGVDNIASDRMMFRRWRNHLGALVPWWFELNRSVPS